MKYTIYVGKLTPTQTPLARQCQQLKEELIKELQQLSRDIDNHVAEVMRLLNK